MATVTDISNYKIIKNTSKIYPNGSVWLSRSSGYFTIIGKIDDGKRSSIHFLCEFEDGGLVVSDMTNIKIGNIQSPNKRSYCGVGYIGHGDCQLCEVGTGHYTKEGGIWTDMIIRCYGQKKDCPSYKSTIVCDRWKCFQYFCEDIIRLPNYDLWKSTNGIYELDKDIICEQNLIYPKIYSPNTCMFITKHDNVSESTTRKNKYGEIWKYYNQKEETKMADLFKVAVKKKYRFNYRGLISVEDLWDLSVEDLDKIYKALKSQQRSASEESLLQAVSKEDKELSNKIEIVKTIVMDKLAASDRAKKAAAQRMQNQRILEIMADKQDAALKEKSLEELRSMLVAEADEDDE